MEELTKRSTLEVLQHHLKYCQACDLEETLKDYTEESITELVNRVIDGIVADGFFLDCPITFHDISVAKRVIIERLKTNYHTRITYPELKTAAQKSAEQEAKKKKKK